MVFVKYSHLFCFSLSVTKNRREKKRENVLTCQCKGIEKEEEEKEETIENRNVFFLIDAVLSSYCSDWIDIRIRSQYSAILWPAVQN